MQRRDWIQVMAAGLLGAGVTAVRADDDPVKALRAFLRDARSGRAVFEQTVTSPDGVTVRRSRGGFEFLRPGRFRFDYRSPYQQTIVADGQQVWMHDPELDQVTVREQAAVLGQTPALLLAGESLDEAFVLSPLPAREGVAWVRATPRRSDGGFQWMELGLADQLPVRLELLDAFGQRSSLRFMSFERNPALPEQRFRFVPPVGADVLRQ